MYTIRACPACNGERLNSWPAVIAPFIAEYVHCVATPACHLKECQGCGLRFFDTRFTEAEADRLYGRYRSANYFEVRHRHEFWYTRAVNDGIGHDGREMASRTQACEEFIRRFLDPSAVPAVLDYGGDRGQFIPAALGRQKFVLELSDAPAVPGVQRLADEAEVSYRAIGLVMLCHVLEHHSAPAALLRRLGSLVGGAAPWFYIEVPLERYSLAWAGAGQRARRYLEWLRRHRFAWTLADFCSTASRIRWNIVPPLGVLKCHEHLNFFDERSLRALLEGAGFGLAGCQVVEVQSASGLTRTLQALARRCACPGNRRGSG